MKHFFSSFPALRAAKQATAVVALGGITLLAVHAVSSPNQSLGDSDFPSLTAPLIADSSPLLPSSDSTATSDTSISDAEYHSAQQGIAGGVVTAKSSLIKANPKTTAVKRSALASGGQIASQAFGATGKGASASQSQGSLGTAGGSGHAGGGGGGGTSGGGGGSGAATPSDTNAADAETTSEVHASALAVKSETNDELSPADDLIAPSGVEVRVGATEDVQDPMAGGFAPDQVSDNGTLPTEEFHSLLEAETPDLARVTLSDSAPDSTLLSPNDTDPSAITAVPDTGDTLWLLAAALAGLAAYARRSFLGWSPIH